MQAKKRQNGQHDDNETHQINDRIHNGSSCVASDVEAGLKRFLLNPSVNAIEALWVPIYGLFRWFAVRSLTRFGWNILKTFLETKVCAATEWRHAKVLRQEIRCPAARG